MTARRRARRRVHIIGVLAALTLLAPEVRAGPRVGVPPAAVPPEIDGVASPGERDTAARFTGFLDNAGRRLAERQTVVSLAYDAAALYLLMVSADEPGTMAVCLRPAGAERAVAVAVAPDGTAVVTGDEAGEWAGALSAASAAPAGRRAVEVTDGVTGEALAADVGELTVPISPHSLRTLMCRAR